MICIIFTSEMKLKAKVQIKFIFFGEYWRNLENIAFQPEVVELSVGHWLVQKVRNLICVQEHMCIGWFSLRNKNIFLSTILNNIKYLMIFFCYFTTKVTRKDLSLILRLGTFRRLKYLFRIMWKYLHYLNRNM